MAETKTKKKAPSKVADTLKAKEKKPAKQKGVESTDPSDRSDYHRDYWLSNKAAISAKRKERYHSDPKYRKRHLEQTQQSRHRKREEDAGKKMARDIKLSEKRHKGEGLPNPRLMKIGGMPTACYSTSALARYIARSNETIRRWLTLGVMPGVSYVDDSGHYWFTKNYCEVMRACVEEMYRLPRRRKGGHGDTEVLKGLISAKFKSAKVPVKKVR